ncbi:cytochrome P450 [Lophiotrema nucula]|uniref:Cytochrome P450 n=1 Tax=Lophiotrema nucula TaxID=690887 RepID=A0A6A5ZRS9_9PLEO|nr:cytochrome P450 [Lophiotrema nucula]
MADYSRITLCLAAAILATAFLFRRRPKLSPNREPPCIPQLFCIPYIGHMIGLFWQRTAYYSNVSKKWNLPIFSLSMFGGKVYVVSSPDLMHSLHRQPRVVSFWFIEGQFTTLLGGMSKASADALQANLGAADRESSLLVEGLKVTQQAMSPQGGMEEMNRRAAAVVRTRLDELQETGGTNRVDLWGWIQHEITIATTESIYGLGNPYRDPKVESAFWDFADDTIMVLLSRYLPKALAPKGVSGREVVVQAMNTYFGTGAYKDSSPLTSARYAALKGHINDEDLARFECVNGIAILGNSVPTAFWTIYHIFSDPALLVEVRAQVEMITSNATAAGSGRRMRKINLRALKEAPLLFSVMQEALRHRATGTGPRMVMEDTMVGQEKYHLEKGAAVIIANHALHFDASAWGASADRFVADRFCGKTPAHAFRGFGGGINLCPGKGFAMVEIAAFAAMMAMRFDLLPADGSWDEPGQNLTNMSLQIAPPGKKVYVTIAPRQEAHDVDWEFDS